MYLPIVFGRPGCRNFIYLKDLIMLVCMPFWLKCQNGWKDQKESFLIPPGNFVNLVSVPPH